MSDHPAVFGSYGRYERSSGQWLAALSGSVAVYAVIGAAFFLLGKAAREIAQEKAVPVTFVEKVVKAEPPPAPPAPPEPRAEAPPAAAPVIPKGMKVVKLEKPPPARQLVAPKEMPKEPAPEADPGQDKGIAVYGEPGEGDPAGLAGGMAGGVAGGSAGAIALPENADPPEPVEGNVPPEYPQIARAEGKTGEVILKVVVLASGKVGDVEVMRGEEPFASAAVKAVKTWTYRPARFNGQPITVYRIVRIPFKLTA